MNSTVPQSFFDTLVQRVASIRIASSRVFGYLLAGLLLISHHASPPGGVQLAFLQTLGLALAGVGALGRVWASMFIAGYKDSTLVTEGPYSVVRNPLYVFSFIGALGIACGTGSLLVIALLVVGFLLYYPITVISEERNLSTQYGGDYTEYAGRTPRFIPDFSLYRESEAYTVKTRNYRRAILDAIWFVWIFGLVQLIGRLHEAGWLPNWICLP
jgi:protein-S-isoprenylcysteine O-methyltransferase Ste14